MKNFALILLLTTLTLHLRAAGIHSPVDTLRCDTIMLREGITLYARVLELEDKAYFIQFCKDGRMSKISANKIQLITYGDGTIKTARDIRGEVWPTNRNRRKGVLNLIGAFYVGLLGYGYAGLFLYFGAPALGIAIALLASITLIFLVRRGIRKIQKPFKPRKSKKSAKP